MISIRRNTKYREEAINLIIAQNRSALLASAICLLGLYFVFENTADNSYLAIFALCYLVIFVIRQHLTRRFRRFGTSHIPIEKWVSQLTANQLASGIAWGLLSAYLCHIAEPLQLLPVVVIMSSLATGALVAYAYFLRVYLAFTLPLVFSVTITLFTRDEQVMITVGTLFLLWFATLFFYAVRFADIFTKMINAAAAREELAKSMEHHTKKTFELNETLNEKVDALEQAQQQIIEEKNRAELLAIELHRMSRTDVLTSIANRRAFNEEFTKAFNQCLQNRQEIAVILADVDSFKTYNDIYGHRAGDACLAKLAQKLSRTLPKNVHLARYGGEEFAIILPHTNSKEAMAVAEYCRAAIQQLKIPHKHSNVANEVTMSFGVSSQLVSDSVSKESLLQQADIALYDAKFKGRNQCQYKEAPQKADLETSE